MTLIDRDGMPRSPCRNIREFEEYLAKVDLWARNAPIIDAVEVVRCKNCAMFQEKYKGFGLCEKRNGILKPTDFCSCGVRKEYVR